MPASDDAGRALGRLDFFESALAFMAGYGIRAYLIAQSLNQIAKAYGENNAILDNCHVRTRLPQTMNARRNVSPTRSVPQPSLGLSATVPVIGSRLGSATSWSAGRKLPVRC